MENTNDVDETELDYDKRYDLYTREMEYLDKLQIANTGDFCRAIRYFSGFSIPLILTITDISLSKNWAIWVTVGLFLGAILCSIGSHVLSDYGIDKRREYIGLFWIYQKRVYRNKQSRCTQWGTFLDSASLIAFLLGVVLFISFLINGSLIIQNSLITAGGR